MAVLDKVALRSENETLISTARSNYSVKEFSYIAYAIRERHRGLKGHAILLKIVDRQAVPFYLAAFDGFAERMAIVPQAVADEPEIASKLIGFDEVIVNILDDALLVATALDAETYNPIDTKWIIPTSGTTGTPKLIEHTFCALTSKLKDNLERGKSVRWAMFYDVSRFAGLQVMLQVILGGSSIVWTDGLSLENSVTLMLNQKVNAISATPTMWRKLLMAKSFNRLQLKHITMGGEIANQAILDAVAQYFSDARVTHIYASTELGVGFSVIDRRAGFPSAWIDSGLPDGRRIKIEENRLFFWEDGNSSKAGEWVDSEDIVEVREDRCFFMGRASGAINVGGNKVMPDEVEAALMLHQDVSLARVRARANPIIGNLIVADVVAKKGLNSDDQRKRLKSDLIATLSKQLEAYKVPSNIYFVNDIELTEAGKIKRL